MEGAISPLFHSILLPVGRSVWTTCNFDRMASVSAMLETLSWRTLEQRRADSIFYKIVNNMVAVPLSDYIKPNPRTSRRGHSMTFQQIHTGKDFYKYSFFPLAVAQWNTLAESAVSSPSLDIFKAEIGKLQHVKSSGPEYRLFST